MGTRKCVKSSRDYMRHAGHTALTVRKILWAHAPTGEKRNDGLERTDWSSSGDLDFFGHGETDT